MIARDKEVNFMLQKHGWHIIRFWGNDILKNLDNCVIQVIEAVNKKK